MDLHPHFVASHTRPVRRAGCAMAFVAATAMCGAARAQVYVGDTAASESVVLSNFRSNDTPQLLIAVPRTSDGAPPAAFAGAGARQPAPTGGLPLPPSSAEVRRVIDEVALKVGISADLLHAVIATESRYNSRALSPRGAIGLMQLLPATAKRFGALHPYAPHENVLAGAQYLKWLMAMFRDDLELVLAAYNAGEQAVVKAGGRIPPFAETQAYVPRVLAYLRCSSGVACKPA